MSLKYIVFTPWSPSEVIVLLSNVRRDSIKGTNFLNPKFRVSKSGKRFKSNPPKRADKIQPSSPQNSSDNSRSVSVTTSMLDPSPQSVEEKVSEASSVSASSSVVFVGACFGVSTGWVLFCVFDLFFFFFSVFFRRRIFFVYFFIYNGG